MSFVPLVSRLKTLNKKYHGFQVQEDFRLKKKVYKQRAIDGIKQFIDFVNFDCSLTATDLKMLTIVLMGHGRENDM